MIGAVALKGNSVPKKTIGKTVCHLARKTQGSSKAYRHRRGRDRRETPVTITHYLGITPKWVDGTAVGGCSFMIHVRHAAAADRLGAVRDVLNTHGESGRSGVGRTRNVVAPTSLAGQFEQPYGPLGPPTLFMIPVLRYMKTYGLSHEQLAMVSVVQREWAGKNARETPGQPALAAVPRTPVTVEDVNCGRACFETRPPGAPRHEVSLSYLKQKPHPEEAAKRPSR